MGSKSISSGNNSPCASCKLLRRRCAKDCIFAPYFPSDDPHKFAIVHKVFGASNISKMLQEVKVDERADAVSSLVYEANARIRDPIYGCVGAIYYLQTQVSELQMHLAMARAQIQILCNNIQMQQQQHHYNYSSSSSSSANIAAAGDHPQLDVDVDDDKSSFFLENDNYLIHYEYINDFASSTNNNVIKEIL